MAHVTPDQLRSRCPDAATATDEELEAMLAHFSAVFDAFARYRFEPAPSSPAPRRVYGSGTPYLEVGPYVGSIAAEAVTNPQGRKLPAFIAVGEDLVAVTAEGNRSDRIVWPDGLAIDVSARWGSAAPPADVQEAVLVMTIAAIEEGYAQTRETWSGTVGIDFDLPPRARKTIDDYARTAALRASL